MSPLVLSCIRTAPDAISKASIIRVKGLEVLGKARTSCLVNVACQLWNVVSWLGPQVQGFDCLVRSRRGQAMSKKEGMNFWQKLQNPRKDHMALTLASVDHS